MPCVLTIASANTDGVAIPKVAQRPSTITCPHQRPHEHSSADLGRRVCAELHVSEAVAVMQMDLAIEVSPSDHLLLRLNLYPRVDAP
jgi:hypothetical protein